MTKEEKIQLLTDLINTPGNTTKLIRFTVLECVKTLEDETQLDKIISILQSE